MVFGVIYISFSYFVIFKGGLDKETQASQGAAGSAFDDMCASRMKILSDGKDLQASKYL